MMDNFNSGYTKALLDIRNFFDQNGYSWSRNSLKTLIDIFVENREEMRKNGEIAGLLWSKKDGFFLKK